MKKKNLLFGLLFLAIFSSNIDAMFGFFRYGHSSFSRAKSLFSNSFSWARKFVRKSVKNWSIFRRFPYFFRFHTKQVMKRKLKKIRSKNNIVPLVPAFFYGLIVMEDKETGQKLIFLNDVHVENEQVTSEQRKQIINLVKQLQNEGKSVKVIVEDRYSFILKEKLGKNVDELLQKVLQNINTSKDPDGALLSEINMFTEKTFDHYYNFTYGCSPLFWLEFLCKKHSIPYENIEFRGIRYELNAEKEIVVLNEIKNRTEPKLFESIQAGMPEIDAGIDIKMLETLANNQEQNVILFCVGGAHAENVVQYLARSGKYHFINARNYISTPRIYIAANDSPYEFFTDLKETALQEIHMLSQNRKTRD